MSQGADPLGQTKRAVAGSGRSGGQKGSPELGAKLRSLRQSRQMTISLLAEEAQLSKGYISQIESGYKVPHWSTLMRVLHILGERLCSFLADTASKGSDIILLAGSLPDKWGHVAEADEQGYTWILTPSNRGEELLSEVLRIRIPGHASWTSDPVMFAAPVVAYGIEGQSLIEIGKLDRDEFVLDAGRVLAYNGRRLHRIRNHTSNPSEVLLVLTPPGA